MDLIGLGILFGLTALVFAACLINIGPDAAPADGQGHAVHGHDAHGHDDAAHGDAAHGESHPDEGHIAESDPSRPDAAAGDR